MSEERMKILNMVASGKISADEADRLLSAIETQSNENNKTNGKSPKFLHVKVEKCQDEFGKDKNVDIKIPIILLKAGVKLGSIMPGDAKAKISSELSEKGISLDLNNISSKEIDLLISTLTEASIDIDTDMEKVKIFCA